MGTEQATEARDDGPARSRLTAAQIFEEGVKVGEDELERSSAGLWFSGLAAGIAMGLSGLGSATILAAVGHVHAAELLGALLYPLGFIVVIVGRAQLFTENTLFPVIVVLDRRRHLLNTARLWGLVLSSNILGAVLFALLMVTAGTLEPSVRHSLLGLGDHASTGSWMHLFWGGVAAGWIIALVAWVVSGSRFTIGQVALIWLLTFVVGAAHLPHCIAGSAEILCAVLAGHVSVGAYLYWLSAATIGNAVGGVVIVSVLNYAQVIGSGHDNVRETRDRDSAKA